MRMLTTNEFGNHLQLRILLLECRQLLFHEGPVNYWNLEILKVGFPASSQIRRGTKTIVDHVTRTMNGARVERNGDTKK